MARQGSPADPKVAALRESRCLNPHPEQVTDEAFLAEEFFDARDAVQVKYEMVRRVSVDGAPVTATAAAFGYSRPSYYRVGRLGAGQARAPQRPQAHRADPDLGRTAAGGRSGAETRRPGRADRRGIRGARAPPLHRASAGPPPGALQKPLTCPSPSAGRRRTRPCPCDLHLAMRLLNQARHPRTRMPARLVFPAAGSTPATSNCVMPPCMPARPRSRWGWACSPARASPPGGAP
jgi:hypothetical protein